MSRQNMNNGQNPNQNKNYNQNNNQNYNQTTIKNRAQVNYSCLYNQEEL